jgi:hypothetical protein
VKSRAVGYLPAAGELSAGCSYGASRPTDDGQKYWRTMHWLFPFYTMSPVPKLGSTALWTATVPVDDHHCMSWSMSIVVGEGARPTRVVDGPNPSGARTTLPNTTDWLGRFRNPLTLEVENDFGLDRTVQSAKPATVRGYTGLADVNHQDEAMRWSQGRANDNGIVNRTREHLGTTDSMIIRVRRRLLDAAKALNERNVPPPGVENPWSYRLRSGWAVLPENVDWWEGSRELRETFIPAMAEPPAIAT